MKFTGFDHFDDELGGDDKIIEAQSWGGPFKDMKRSYAPENLSPGSLIPCVAAPKLEFFLSCRPFLNMFSKRRNSNFGGIQFVFSQVKFVLTNEF